MLPLDHVLFLHINASAATPAAVVGVATWLSQSLPMSMAGAFILALLGGGRLVQRELLATLAGLLLAAAVAYLIRRHWPEPRPAQLGLGIQWIAHGMRSGFPSMHATLAFALAQGLLTGQAIRDSRLGRCVIAVAWLAAMAIGWSRVCLGVHLPGDLLGGAIVGIASASAVAALAGRVSGRGRSSSYWSRPVRP